MEEQQGETRLAATFPAPPPFWKEFTEENISRISELRAAQSGEGSKMSDPATSLPVRILDLPPELRFLQPPEEPTDGIYRSFGDIYNVRVHYGHRKRGLRGVLIFSIAKESTPVAGGDGH
jgi:mediator of RNA polymerase II transcription subunit 7